MSAFNIIWPECHFPYKIGTKLQYVSKNRFRNRHIVDSVFLIKKNPFGKFLKRK